MPNITNPTNIEVLSQRTTVVENAVTQMAGEISRMSTEWRKALADQDAEFRRELSSHSQSLGVKIEGLASDLKKRSEIPWQALGVVLSFVIVVGALAYWPIRERQAQFDEILTKLAEAQVTQLDTLRTNYSTKDELDWRSARSKEDRERVDMTIRNLQASVFPREVHAERWQRIDSQMDSVRHDLDLQVANLQRQIEQVQRSQSDTYTARDAILDMKNRVDQLENLLRRRENFSP